MILDPSPRTVAALVGLAGLVTLIAFGVAVLATGEEQPPPSSSSASPVFDELPTGWTALPGPPEVRSLAATAWTGERLLVWGGYVYSGFGDEGPKDDGFAFDARARRWERIAASPLGPRVLSASAWTGRELLIWGGSDDRGGFFEDGAAYEPKTDTWRRLPPAPIDGRAPLSVWTGRELIVWGTAVRVTKRPRDGAAYDPSTDSWRPIADAPIELTDATAVWTGREMIVFGAALHGGNLPESPTAIGAAHDPASDTWRELPDSELSTQASTAAWTGQELVAWDYTNGSAAYHPAANRWRSLSDVPLDAGECTPESVVVGSYVVGDYCGLMVAFDPRRDTWHDISRREYAGWGLEFVPADPVVLVLAHEVETGDARMLAYRPPTW